MNIKLLAAAAALTLSTAAFASPAVTLDYTHWQARVGGENGRTSGARVSASSKRRRVSQTAFTDGLNTDTAVNPMPISMKYRRVIHIISYRKTASTLTVKPVWVTP